MTTTDRTDMRKVARWGGVAYLATFAFSLPALALKAPVLDHADFVLGNGAQGGVLVDMVFELATALAGIATAIALWPAIRRVSQPRALGFVASRTLEASMIFVGVVALLSIVTLRDVGGDADTLVTTARGLVAVHDWTFLLGPGVMAPINALMLATCLLQARLVPGWMPRLGLIAVPLLLASDIGTIFGWHDQLSATATLMALPIAVWEFSLGCRLTFRGFLPSPVLDDEPVEPVAPALATA